MGVIVGIQKIGTFDKIIIYIILSYILSSIISILDVFLFNRLFDNKFNKDKILKFIIINSLSKFIILLLSPIKCWLIFDYIITTILFRMILNKKIEKCILIQTINLFCNICSQIIITKFMIMLYDDFSIENLSYCYYVGISIIIFRSIVYALIKLKKLTINLNDNLSKITKTNINIIIIFESIIMYLNSIILLKYIRECPYVIFLLDFIVMLFGFYLILEYIMKLSKIEEQSIEIENLETYNKTLTIMYDNIRGFKHDYANFIQSLSGYVQTNNLNGIKQMCKSVCDECRNVNNLGFLDPDLINNAPIYSIITSKYYLALENDIIMNIEVFINFEEIKDEIYELCKILAILLDNAIEAAKDCEEKIINIRFQKDDIFKERILFIIENTYKEQKIDIGKIFEKGFTTKNDNNDEHGLGLWTVRKILNKSKCMNLYTSKDDELFCQKLEIC